jgi:sec-independent protein translocase protein TatA
MNLGPTELIIILVIVMLLFGATRLPKLARSLGQASKEFKEGIREGAKDDDGKESGKDARSDSRS